MKERETPVGTFIPKKPACRTSRMDEVGMIEISLAERVKQLMLFAKNADEVDVLAEAYRKISGE